MHVHVYNHDNKLDDHINTPDRSKLMTNLIDFLTPPPHVLEQSPYGTHSPHSPSIGARRRRATHLPIRHH